MPTDDLADIVPSDTTGAGATELFLAAHLGDQLERAERGRDAARDHLAQHRTWLFAGFVNSTSSAQALSRMDQPNLADRSRTAADHFEEALKHLDEITGKSEGGERDE